MFHLSTLLTHTHTHRKKERKKGLQASCPCVFPLKNFLTNQQIVMKPGTNIVTPDVTSHL